MSVLYILLPMALLFSALAVGIFIWAVRKGQFDDLETPGMRMLQDDDVAMPTETGKLVDATEAEEAGAD